MASYIFQKATKSDVSQIISLYDELNDYLEKHTNYPNWKKGVYPISKTAQVAFELDTLFCLKQGDVIVASVILNHLPEKGYELVNWGVDFKDSEVLIIHTCVVNPLFVGQRVGSELMDAIRQYALSMKIKAIRLDVSVHNQPAIALYEKANYMYIATVDLNLEIIDLKWFRLYQLLL